MPKKHPKPMFGRKKPAPNKKRRLILAGILLVMLLGGVFLPSLLLDPNYLRALVNTQVKALTGHELKVKGAVTMRVLPTPTLTLKNVELDTGAENVTAPRLRAESLTVQLAFSGLFEGKPLVEGVTLAKPVLEIERSHDGQIHWDWLNAPGLAGGLPAALSIQGGKAVYVNPTDERVVRVENIDLAVTEDPKTGVSATGQMSYLDKPLHVKLALPPLVAGQGTHMEVRFWQTDATLLTAALERTASPTGESLWHGALQGQVEDVVQWLPKDTLPTPAATTPAKPYAMKLAGKLDYAGEAVKISDIVLETADSAGKGEATVTLGAKAALDVRMAFNRLKLESATLAHVMGGDAQAAALAQSVPSPVDIAESASRLPKNINLTFQLGAESLFIDSQQFSTAVLKGGLQGGELLIESLQGGFAGGTAISLSGKIVDTAKGMRFQGRTETSGKDLRATLASFDPVAARLPDKGFNEYYIAANVFLSPEQLRLSEADFRLGDLHLNGGLVTYFEAQPRVEAEIALTDINLDYFRDTWREGLKQGGGFTFKINSSVDFSWLKTLKPIVDLKMNLQHFTFLEKTGDSASFQIYAKQNEFGLRNIQMHYPQGMLKGSATVTVNDLLPHLDIDVQVPEFNTAYFSPDGKQLGEPWINSAKPDARWSQELFDFGWMIGVSSKMTLAANRVIHRGENYDSFLMQGTLSAEQLQVSNLTFQHFGGKIDAKGSLSGGKVPGLSGTFTAYNIDLKQLLQDITPANPLTGRVSVSGGVVTSGINFEEWVKQADMKMVVAGRGVRTEHFNLAGVGDAVLASRSVADVVTNINRTLPVASTDFSMDGSININGGVVRTPGLALQGGNATGTFTGELRLLPWKMAMSSVFQMKMLNSDPAPTLTVDISGTPDNYETKLDTSSLEAFVAKRIVGN